MNEPQQRPNLSGLYVAKSGPVVVPTVKAIDPEKGVFRVLISTEHRDRDGDRVRQRGMSTDNYRRNKAPVFWGHQSGGLPIGKTIRIKREKLADGVWGTWAEPKLATEIEDYPLPRIVRDLLALDMAGPSSIGFIPTKVADLPDEMLTDDERQRREMGGWIWGKDIIASDLLEWSFVGIPANPNVDVDQNGIAKLDRESVERMTEVAARHLSGGALKDFRRSLQWSEVSVCLGCTPIEKAPERVRAALSPAIEPDVDDDGFDDEPEVKAAPERVERSEPPKYLTIGELEAITARVVELEARVATVTPEPAPVVTIDLVPIKASFADLAAHVDVMLEKLARRVEDSHAEFHIAHLADVERVQREAKSNSCGCSKAATKPALVETTPDPARVAKSAHTPAALAVRQTIEPSPQLIAALIPALVSEVRAAAADEMKRAIYAARGGVTLPQNGVSP